MTIHNYLQAEQAEQGSGDGASSKIPALVQPKDQPALGQIAIVAESSDAAEPKLAEALPAAPRPEVVAANDLEEALPPVPWHRIDQLNDETSEHMEEEPEAMIVSVHEARASMTEVEAEQDAELAPPQAGNSVHGDRIDELHEEASEPEEEEPEARIMSIHEARVSMTEAEQEQDAQVAPPQAGNSVPGALKANDSPQLSSGEADLSQDEDNASDVVGVPVASNAEMEAELSNKPPETIDGSALIHEDLAGAMASADLELLPGSQQDVLPAEAAYSGNATDAGTTASEDHGLAAWQRPGAQPPALPGAQPAALPGAAEAVHEPSSSSDATLAPMTDKDRDGNLHAAGTSSISPSELKGVHSSYPN